MYSRYYFPNFCDKYVEFLSLLKNNKVNKYLYDNIMYFFCPVLATLGPTHIKWILGADVVVAWWKHVSLSYKHMGCLALSPVSDPLDAISSICEETHHKVRDDVQFNIEFCRDAEIWNSMTIILQIIVIRRDALSIFFIFVR